MSEKQKEACAEAREWVKELLDTVPDEKLMAVVRAMEDVALTEDGPDPFYSAENMNRLKRVAARMETAFPDHGVRQHE